MAGPTKSRAYVREWMELAGLKQADLVKLLDYSKAKANAIWHGEQRLNEDILDQIAPIVHAERHELLQHPEDAMFTRKPRGLFDGVAKPVETPPPPAAPAQAARRKAS